MAITVLSVIDGALVLALPALDKRLYKSGSREPVNVLFMNIGDDSPFHRFMYSRFGPMLISVIFIGIICLTNCYGHGNW